MINVQAYSWKTASLSLLLPAMRETMLTQLVSSVGSLIPRVDPPSKRVTLSPQPGEM